MESPYNQPMHAFPSAPLATPHMPSYTPTPTSQQQQQRQVAQQQQQSDTTDRARAYKSRNKRPCDFCRYKKAACHLDSHPPCELCLRYNKECTFVESPAKRRRPNENNGDSISSNANSNGMLDYSPGRNNSIGGTTTPFGNGNVGMDMSQNMISWEHGLHAFQMPSLGIDSGLGEPDFSVYDPALYQDPPMGFDPFEPMSATTVDTTDHKTFHQQRNSLEMTLSPTSSTAGPPAASLSLPFDSTSGEPSLDQQNSSNATLVGQSGELDPYLLSRYRYDQYNEATFQSVRMRKMNDGLGSDDNIPTFFTIQHNALASKAQPPERSEVLDRYRREVEGMVSDDVGKRLIRLFYKYVQPHFPILSREGGSFPRDDIGVREPCNIATCILAAIYGHALPFCPWDEKLCVDVYTPPSADALFRIAWLSALAMCHTPNFAPLQTFLLMVQRRPTNKHVSDTPFKGVMMTAAVSLAQSLGLHRDPSDWPLPAWEIRQRRRLAWATFTQDKWLALTSGRSSFIQSDDWDVAPLSDDDFAAVDQGGPAGGVGPQHFIKLCELGLIVDDILHDMFSIKATKALQNSLEATLEVAKPLRIRLTEWYQSLPNGLLPHPSSSHGAVSSTSSSSPGEGPAPPRKVPSHELNGNGSLHLAYITAKIELFRAMLRPRVTDTNANAVSALRTGAFAAAKEVLDFLEGLDARELEAFWASYARTNFVIATSFMLTLYVTSPTLTDAKGCLALLNSWRALLRIKSRSCDLLNLALLRLDGVFVAGIDRLIDLSPAAAQAWTESGH